MKTRLLLLPILAMLFSFIVQEKAQAQFYALSKAVAVNKAYANDQIDTSTTITGMGSYDNVGVVFKAVDSVSTKIYIDTRPYGGTTWTLKDSVTITGASNTLNIAEWQLRGPTVDKIGSATASIRFRSAFASSANGVSTPTYTQTLYYR